MYFLLSLAVNQGITNKAVSMYWIAGFLFPILVEATFLPSTPVLLWVASFLDAGVYFS